MDIRNSLDGLKTLLGVAPTATAATQQPKSGAAAGGSALNADSATLSSAGSVVSLTAADSNVRTEKVAGIQAALAAGNYKVAPSAIASKVVDSMLAGHS